MSIRGTNSVCAAAILVAALITIPLQAGEVHWTSDADGSWHVSSNWSSDPLFPGPTDNVTIDRLGFDVEVIHSQNSTVINDLLCSERLTLDGGEFTLAGAGQISGALTIGSGASLAADGPAADVLADGATTLNGGNLHAVGGGELSLPNASAYLNPSTDAWSHGSLKADGAGSVLDLSNLIALAGSTGSFSVLSIQSLDGGFVDFNNITEFTTGGVQVLADTGGAVNLANITSMTPGPVFGVTNSITARNGGAVHMHNLTILDGVDLNIDGTGATPTSQISAYTNGVATLSGVSHDFSGLTNVSGTRFVVSGGDLDLTHMTAFRHATIELKGGADAYIDNAVDIDGASFIATGGGELHAVSATTRSDSRTDAWSHGWLKADGAGSVLDLSNLTVLAGSTGSFSVLKIEGAGGGLVDLNNITEFTTGGVQVLADTGGVVNLSNLTHMTPGTIFGVTNSITARNGGEVHMHNLAILDGVNLNIDGTGTMPTSQISVFTNGVATVSGVNPDFSGLTNVSGSHLVASGVHLDLSHMTSVSGVTVELLASATADINSATNIDGASFVVKSGTTLIAPAASNRPDSRTDSWSHGRLGADGAASVLDMSNITGLAGSTGVFSVLNIECLSGGRVDLSGVAAYDTGGGQVLPDGDDSVVDLSSLATLATGPLFGVTNTITARNGGTVKLHPAQTLVSDATIVLDPGGTIEVGALVLGAGGEISGNGRLDARITALADSSIAADTGDMTLGDAGSDDGFAGAGSLLTGANTVTINDRDLAVLGVLTQLGDGADGGELIAGAAAQGDDHAHFLLPHGGEMTGRGSVIGNLRNQGGLIGDGPAADQRIILESDWIVSGDGSFENVVFKGTFAPGDSPAMVSTTNAWYSGATVQVELGGTSPGSADDNHDRINEAALVRLDPTDPPTLEILPYSGFLPEVGDEVVVMTWREGLVGAFGDVIVDPWFTDHGLDFDLHYNNPDGPGDLTLTATPEPATMIMIAVGVPVLLKSRRRR